MPGAAIELPGHLAPDPRRWQALGVIAVAQLMVVVDTTVVNIAIPSTQADLGMSNAALQWIIAAYTLPFGGLLLFGGRVTDVIGRRRAFIAGLLGFAVASAAGGAAVSGEMLVVARALQGMSGALLSPAALAMITVMFTDARERGKAFGIYNAIAGSGLAVGLILGGVLTQFLNWRWAFYISIPLALVAAGGALIVVREHGRDRPGGRLDLPGALLVGAGLVATVLAFDRGASQGWGSARALQLFAVAAVLLAAFTLVESRSAEPLLPLRLLTQRDRAGVYLSLGLAVMTMFGLFLFMTSYLQTVKEYSPLVGGFAFLPMVAGMVLGSTQVGGRLLPRTAPRHLIAGGFVVAAVGLIPLTWLQVDTPYATSALPAGVLIGLGLGTAFVPAMSLATRVGPQDTGIASAMVNAVQEVGGSVGTVLLNSIAVAGTAAYAATHPGPRGPALVHGYVTATWWAMGILLLAALVAAVFVTAGPERSSAVPVKADPSRTS